MRQQLKRLENCAQRDDSSLAMQSILVSIVAAVVLVGCGESQQSAPDISIIEAVRKGNVEAVKQHLAAGTDVNAKGRAGQTPLNEAALRGHKEVVELLIAKGANVNEKDADGWTPLDWARNHPETAKLLRKHGGKKGRR